MYSKFASIGLKMLIPALGTQPNTVEYIPEKHLDESASGCFLCPHYRKEDSQCASCEKRVFYTKTKKVYINEKNRYGLQKTLKKNALLLYLTLHFLNPDDNGFIACADTSDLAAKLGCLERTVENNLDLLDRAGFICVGSHPIEKCHQIFINGYKDIFRKANEGGRGFIRLSLDFLDQLSLAEDINTIRLSIRAYIESAEAGPKSTAQEKSLKAMKNLLPSYVTKKSLLSKLSGEVFSKLFTVKTKARSAIIKIKDTFDQAHVLDMVREKCRHEVKALRDQINDSVRSRKTTGPLFNLSEKELTDIANIAIRFPIDAVLEATETFYKTYIKRNIAYGSVGALVRSFTEDIVIIS